ncbi:MAG: exodeoxyribonuclease-3 [Sphingobacteriales bacterium]|jgi:exodeoxyribonuclease-3
MAFRKKAEAILSENPDILIVPECENLEKLTFNSTLPIPNDKFWYGDNPNKGIGVFTFGEFTIEPLKIHNQKFRYIVPLSIKGNGISFILLAIWTQKPELGDNYGSHTWNAIKYYKELFKDEKIILAGDFNSSSFWDKRNRKANHTNIISELENLGIESVYHKYLNEEQGKESCPTLFLHRKIERPYHIDFCFASDYFVKRLNKVEVGIYNDWIKHSDHCPIIVDFKI